jgi:3-hydroxyisobutyrate dehydrogenase-like beta-hydroxyacid dehydrogenase
MRVGFIGLGRMGSAIALRILGGGHDVVAYDLDERRSTELAGAGAQAVASVADACAGRDVVITMLPDDAALEAVALGPGGIRDSLDTPGIHLAMGTHGVAAIRRVAAAHADSGQALVAAPVLGRPDVAAEGGLCVIPAGPEHAVRACTPLFTLVSRRQYPAGPTPERAAAIKLANGLVLGCAIEAFAEALSLARKYGVAPEVLYAVVTEGPSSSVYSDYGRIMLDETFDRPGFTARLGLKDTDLVLEAGELVAAPLPSIGVLRDRLLGAIAHGDGDRDWAVVAREQARASGIGG